MTGVARSGVAVAAPAAGLEQLLQRQIPLARAMQVAVLEATGDTVRLCAPLAPNINVHSTLFGGSAAAVAILAAWSLLYLRLRPQYPAASIVIQRHGMRYNRPIQGGFEAHAHLAQPAEWPRFLRLLARRGKARITVATTLEYDGAEAAAFSGDFVALSGV